jgi:hypothetical protein
MIGFIIPIMQCILTFQILQPSVKLSAELF